MPGVIAQIPKLQFSSLTGAPLAGGTLDVYIAGSTTRANTWQDSALTALNTNPIVLDSRGACVVWLDAANAYKLVLKNAGGVAQWTQDNISGGGVSTAIELSAASIEAARTETSASAASVLSIQTQINHRYRGALSADPATRTDGSANVAGDEYFNDVVNLLKRWNGATWQASDINTADLAASGGTALVGYDGGLAQTVLDDAKPMANYAALRAYTGRAIGVRITAPSVAGHFYRDASDATSSDNGGTVIVDASGRRWKRLFVGAVNVKWFGAVGNGIADDVAAFQAAINFCLATKTTTSGALGGGATALYAPQGIYKISAPLIVSGANGFKIYGDGRQSTQLVFTGAASYLFAYTAYICCTICDMTLVAGSINTTGALPVVTPQATKDNIGIRFNGDGGGTLFTVNRVQMYYWDKVFTTTNNIVNCDNHIHTECSFLGNNYVWVNTNTQAVVWTFTDCKVFSTAITIFSNPGISLLVRGGDFINPGTFCAGSLASTTTNLLFDGINFENYQNIDAAAAPKFLDISGTHVITFRHCTARGGGTLVGKTSAVLAGIYSIKIEKCYFTGNWNANVTSSAGGAITSHLVFEECEQVPSVVQTLSGAQGNRPLNLEYRKHPVAINTYIDRVYMGALATQSATLAGTPMFDAIRFEGAINAATLTKSVPILVFAPYTVLVTGIRLAWTNNTSAVCTITVWQDNTKAVQLATFTTAASSGNQQYFEARAGAGLSAIAQMTSGSEPLYFEVTSAGNAGATKAVLTFETMQSTL